MGFAVVFFGWNKVLPENLRKILTYFTISCYSNRQNKSQVNNTENNGYQQPEQETQVISIDNIIYNQN